VDGGALRLRAHYGVTRNRQLRLPIDSATLRGHALLRRETIRATASPASRDIRRWVEDAEGRGEVPVLPEEWGGPRSITVTPLIREETPIGTLLVRRNDEQEFSDRQVALLETFAAQAVIAIENARLFDELQQKTREQAETLEEQAATNHILEIISQSPTDVQPVLDAICESAARASRATDVVIRLAEDENLVLAAHTGALTAGLADIQGPEGGTFSRAAMTDRTTFH